MRVPLVLPRCWAVSSSDTAPVALGSSPVDQSALAAPLMGSRPNGEAMPAIGAEAYKGARRLDNTDLHYACQKKMARVDVERALARVCYV